jgi:hypothetical protein
VQELVEMIYKERERTVAVEGELCILRQEITRVQHQRKKKRKCGERGEEDDGDNWESDYECVAGQESSGAAGRSGGVSLGDGNDAALSNGKDTASDGE